MITDNIRLILVVTGALTFIAIIGFFLFPRHSLQRVFGFEEISPALTRVTRSSALVGSLVGALLVYAAFEPGLRGPVMVAATIEKIVFAGSVFLGPLKKSGIARWAAAGDSFMALIFVSYLSGA
jgi:hypothetical protein